MSLNTYLKIPLTISPKQAKEPLEKVPVEVAIKQFIDLLINTRQGECVFNPDFGYELWSNEFEPILNIQKWQPVFMEQIKSLLEEYEQRITEIIVREPLIEAIQKSRRSDRDYKITLTLDYKIKQTGETISNVKISFEY
jgi:phage baseplate assembly protein W